MENNKLRTILRWFVVKGTIQSAATIACNQTNDRRGHQVNSIINHTSVWITKYLGIWPSN